MGTKKQQPKKEIEECGWTIINEIYVFYWFDGPQNPTLPDTFIGVLLKLFRVEKSYIKTIILLL